jgi:pectin methylesterase-like acyl-CoA thioesterase
MTVALTATVTYMATLNRIGKKLVAAQSARTLAGRPLLSAEDARKHSQTSGKLPEGHHGQYL